MFPAALSGVTAGIVLGLSRAVGETMAVTLAAGTQPNLTWDLTQPMQTITAYIVQIPQGEATRGSVEYQSIFAVGLPLFVVTLIITWSRCGSCAASAPSTSSRRGHRDPLPPCLTAGPSPRSASVPPMRSSSAGCWPRS